MYITESVQWLITYLIWLGFSSLIIYVVQRYYIPITDRNASWTKTVFVHVLVASLVGLLVAAVYMSDYKPLRLR
jgi:hypothetical protein